jgi:hypothetical protein
VSEGALPSPHAFPNVLTFAGSSFLDEYPAVTIQIANLGGTIPFLVERMRSVQIDQQGDSSTELAARFRRCYVDTASFGPQAVSLAIQCFGQDRVLLGTDCPISAPKECWSPSSRFPNPLAGTPCIYLDLSEALRATWRRPCRIALIFAVRRVAENPGRQLLAA